MVDERQGAIQASDLLREAEILFHDSALAEERINSIWPDVKERWCIRIRIRIRIRISSVPGGVF